MTATVIALPFAIGAIILFGMILRARPGITILATLSVVASSDRPGWLGVPLPGDGRQPEERAGVLDRPAYDRARLRANPAPALRTAFLPALSGLRDALLCAAGHYLRHPVERHDHHVDHPESIDYWLALVAFGITLYASINLTRHSRKLPM